ncbi:MAG: DUF3316 domain-containing protein [Firmicutes bacterium]|nr:DUF3316 domain-containing protein [Bacillota bacterium]MCM1400658.1 DUF3316 domain-containing protein [Bacteroides sp.]MCM1476349.1 DUF3316 domain-containing protein [Bacteroides sp.]
MLTTPAWAVDAKPASEIVDTATVETIRPVSAFYSIEAGSAHIADTYLTPIKYSGWHTGFDYSRSQAMKFSPEKWTMHLNLSLGFDRVLNGIRNHSMLNGELKAKWGMTRRWKLPYNLSVGVGAQAQLMAGCLYLDRGGNNPASAKASFTLGLMGYAAWQCNLGKIPVTLRYQPSLPVTGVFFAPDYGELYYEIYLGNHSGLAHWAHWGNYFSFNHELTADLRFGATTLRIGYKGAAYSTDVNHTVTNIFTHAAVLGVGGEWISLNPRKKLSADARIISATY